MNELTIFINRRNGQERRLDADPCKNMVVDMYHRKRRKSTDRRDKLRTLEQDYYAFNRTTVSWSEHSSH